MSFGRSASDVVPGPLVGSQATDGDDVATRYWRRDLHGLADADGLSPTTPEPG